MYNMIDLTKLTPDEAEAIAHAEGFTGIAAMFARISDLEFAADTLIQRLEDWGNELPTETAQALDHLRELLS
jgi:hypothetical protein